MGTSKNELTTKGYWNENWRGTRLPVRFYYGNYSYKLVTELIRKHFSGDYKNFIEIGGCPGRWAHYFSSEVGLNECDSMDYDEDNLSLTKKNYEILGIKGKVFFGDITTIDPALENKYDVVLSDGLLEHFVDSRDVFFNHSRLVRPGGLLVVAVPNIKKSWLYDYFARFDHDGYKGYRHVEKDELEEYAKACGLEVLYCGYIGVFNIGLVYTKELGFFWEKIFAVVSLVSSFFLNLFSIKKETIFFSPYIYLISKKYE